VTAKPSSTARAEYVARMVAGGFPPALRCAAASARARWFDDYVRLCLERDVAELGCKQVSWMDGIAGIGHWRTHDGAEVDLVAT
jgi:predicted AAA+ superfamily ATPase